MWRYAIIICIFVEWRSTQQVPLNGSLRVSLRQTWWNHLVAIPLLVRHFTSKPKTRSNRIFHQVNSCGEGMKPGEVRKERDAAEYDDPECRKRHILDFLRQEVGDLT